VSAAFWDASALIPLCVQEPTTAAAELLATQHERVVWWGTLVEIRSTVARRHRSGFLDDVNRRVALDRLTSLRQSETEIAPSSEVRELAGHLLDQYALRAADSLQLAAAFTWCQRKHAGRLFICADLRLAEAAEQAGFTVIRPGVTTP
jgi:predicted nucleic acid-binding protein